LSAEKTFYGAGSEVTLHVSIANPGTTPTRVLKWLIPSEGFTEPLFSVTRDGEAVDYIGMLVKRLPPSEADYITLKAGESLSRNLDLSDYYDLSASGSGEEMWRCQRDTFALVEKISKIPSNHRALLISKMGLVIWISRGQVIKDVITIMAKPPRFEWFHPARQMPGISRLAKKPGRLFGCYLPATHGSWSHPAYQTTARSLR